MSHPAAIPGPLGRLPRLAPRILDGLIALALAAALQLQLALGDRPGGLVANVLGGLALTLVLAWRRRAPLAVVVVFVAAVVGSEIAGGALFSGEPPPVASLVAGVIAFYALGAHAEDRASVVGAGIGVAGLWATVVASGTIDAQSLLFSAGLIVATPWLTGRTMRLRALRAALMERTHEQRERVAVGEERARIARELHDVVAHNVGVMVVQAQGARRMLDPDPERAREALVAIEDTGRAALEEVRRSLGVLRRQGADAPLTPQPGMDGLDLLVEQARRGGLTVELVTEGDARPLPTGVDLSAYRIVQEALTNTRKHAGRVHAQITVRYRADELELEIADHGEPTPGNGAEQGSGHGLVGMRERVALYGGELRAGRARDGRFVVRASLPLAP
ncbi:MAG: sensor histidine kinase [Solirubrobacteraceae bacterium]